MKNEQSTNQTSSSELASFLKTNWLMKKELTEEDLEFKTISTRNYVFSPAPRLQKEKCKYVFEQ